MRCDAKMSIVGNSAGRVLSAAAALRARDARVPVKSQLLIHPAFDHRTDGPNAMGSLDILIDEALDYASRLIRAGVSTELHVCDGVFMDLTQCRDLKPMRSRPIWPGRLKRLSCETDDKKSAAAECLLRRLSAAPLFWWVRRHRLFLAKAVSLPLRDLVARSSRTRTWRGKAKPVVGAGRQVREPIPAICSQVGFPEIAKFRIEYGNGSGVGGPPTARRSYDCFPPLSKIFARHRFSALVTPPDP
jgi:hypothetical protein